MSSSIGRHDLGTQPARRRKYERRVAILKAALKVIQESGLAETRMIDIANLVSMSPGHVLYYFPSKKALLMEALQWSEERFYEDATQQLARLDSAWSRLLRLMELSAPTGRGDPQWLLWLETWAKAPHDEEVARHQAGLGERWSTQVMQTIHEGQDRGEFGPVRADLFALRLTALMDGLAIMVVAGANGMNRRRLLEESRRWAAEQLGLEATSSAVSPS